MRRVFLFLALALVALFAVGLTQANEAEWTTDGIEFVSSLSDVMPDHDVESAFMEMTSHADVDVDADAETEVDAGVDTDVDMESEAETETESEAEAESEATPSIISRVTNAINALRPNTVATAGDSQYEETPDTSNPTAAELAKMNADAHKKCFAGTFVGVCHTAGEVCDGVYNTGACGGGELCCLPRQAPANVAAVAAPMALFARAAPAQVCGTHNVGFCKERAVGCAGGYFQAGLCSGAATVQCCIPTAPPSLAPAAPAPAPAASSAGICSKAAAMANLAVRRGLPASKGKCAKYVGDYIQSQLPSYVRTLYARDIGANLLKAGFKALPQGSRLLPGDVRVIQPIPGHSAGHAQMYVGAAGAMWISDFKQRDEWPGSAWRNNPANIKHTTYRYSC